MNIKRTEMNGSLSEYNLMEGLHIRTKWSLENRVKGFL